MNNTKKPGIQIGAKVVLAETANAMLRNRLEANSCARRCPFRKPLEVNHDTETT